MCLNTHDSVIKMASKRTLIMLGVSIVLSGATMVSLSMRDYYRIKKFDPESTSNEVSTVSTVLGVAVGVSTIVAGGFYISDAN